MSRALLRALDLANIQGNILTAYGRLGFPKGRFLLFHVEDADAGRAFVAAIRPRVTTALRWESPRRPEPHGPVVQPRPDVTVNIAFTYEGLAALRVPTRTLREMPDEFIDGMAARADIIGDSAPTNNISMWDGIWQPGDDDRRVHILVSLNAQMNPDGTPFAALDATTAWLRGLCQPGGVRLLPGHRGGNTEFQEASAILVPDGKGGVKPVAQEHFGYRDGIGDPVFEGQYPPGREADTVVGNGRLTADGKWQPLATGEFLLGHPDEAQETAEFAMPYDFSRNGTFMAYRKLHQNVVAFRDYIDTTGHAFAAYTGIPANHGPATLMAKMAGRWQDGTPITIAPTYEAWELIRDKRATAWAKQDMVTFNAMERDLLRFTYQADPDGLSCPVTAHIRRSNTRDTLDPHFRSPDPTERHGSTLNNRRRILRRGLPYGSAAGAANDSGEHGIIMLMVCASLFRQFEFVQQQWIQYGLDFNAGNDTCPIIGNHGADAKFVIAAPKSGTPFICDRPPQFVETRGGDYFFVPSMTSLRLIAGGIIDPT